MPRMRVMALYGCLVCALLLNGCTDKRILEDLGFTHTTSYDLAPEDESSSGTRKRLLISIAIPKANPDGKTKRETLTTLAQSSKEARILLAKQTELTLVSGQMRSALFGSKLANQGIWDIVDSLIKDPSISQRVRVSVVNGSAHNLLMHEYPQHPRTGQYIDRLLEKEANNQTIPKVSLYTFVRDLFEEGIDPVAPLLKEGKDNVLLAGIALFHGDRYVANIPLEDTITFSMIRGNFRQGEINVDLEQEGKPDQEHVTLSSLVSKRKVQVTRESNDRFKVTIRISITGSVLEYDGELDLTDKKDRHALETRISNNIAGRAKRLMSLLQSNGVDSIGVGMGIRNALSYHAWKQLDWDSMYAQTDVAFQIQTEINNMGMFK